MAISSRMIGTLGGGQWVKGQPISSTIPSGKVRIFRYIYGGDTYYVGYDSGSKSAPSGTTHYMDVSVP